MSQRAFPLLAAVGLTFAAGIAYGDSPVMGPKPIWAKAGELVVLDCTAGSRTSARSAHGDASILLECRANGPADETLRIRYTNKSGLDLSLAVPLKDLDGESWHPREILWAPDGLAFLINGSESAYSGSDFFVFRVEGNALVLKAISPVAQKDMVERLARCWPYIREIVGAKPQFNMSAISWTEDTLNVFAEVPCTAAFENSMCSVYGYEMNARSGDISKVLSATEVNNSWYMQMNWKMAASDLPSCDPQTGKVKER